MPQKKKKKVTFDLEEPDEPDPADVDLPSKSRRPVVGGKGGTGPWMESMYKLYDLKQPILSKFIPYLLRSTSWLTSQPYNAWYIFASEPWAKTADIDVIFAIDAQNYHYAVLVRVDQTATAGWEPLGTGSRAIDEVRALRSLHIGIMEKLDQMLKGGEEETEGSESEESTAEGAEEAT